MDRFSPTGPVCFISTHLDDVVLSCGHFLAAHPGCTVLTVLAGAPDEFHDGYNRRATGEMYAPDAVAKRRAEDDSALALLSAHAVRLPLLDGDYVGLRNSECHDQSEIVGAVDDAMVSVRPASVVTPVGFVHADHIAVSNACLQLVLRSSLDWYLYGDMPYSQRYPELLSERLTQLESTFSLEELEPNPVVPRVKLEAFKRYRSQYVPMGGDRRPWPVRRLRPRRRSMTEFRSELETEERYWRIHRTAPGQEERT
jgi:LmbE family N-acetylglucosaminyl deacetylase